MSEDYPGETGGAIAKGLRWEAEARAEARGVRL